MSGAVKAVVGVAVVVVLIALGVRTLDGDDDGAPDAAGTISPERSSRTIPATPDDVPAEGLYVASSVTKDGEVEVQTWLRSATPVDRLDLTTTDPDLLPGSVESLDVMVRTLDGKLVAHRDSVGTNRQRIRLRQPATELYLTYTVDGGMDDASETVAGRTLARVVAMDVDYAGATGVVRRVVSADAGTVINVACIQATEDFNATPRPCGRPTDDGGWTVDLKGAHRADRLLAQIEQ